MLKCPRGERSLGQMQTGKEEAVRKYKGRATHPDMDKVRNQRSPNVLWQRGKNNIIFLQEEWIKFEQNGDVGENYGIWVSAGFPVILLLVSGG